MTMQFKNITNHSDGAQSTEIFVNDTLVGKLWLTNQGVYRMQETAPNGKSIYIYIGTTKDAVSAYLKLNYASNEGSQERAAQAARFESEPDATEDDSQFYTGGKAPKQQYGVNQLARPFKGFYDKVPGYVDPIEAEMHAMEAEQDRAQTLKEETAKAEWKVQVEDPSDPMTWGDANTYYTQKREAQAYQPKRRRNHWMDRYAGTPGYKAWEYYR